MSDSKLSAPKSKSVPEGANVAMPPQRVESKQVPVSPSAVEVEPANEEIAALAYQFWTERGSPHGSHDEDWLRAEQQLRGNQSSSDKPLADAAKV